VLDELDPAGLHEVEHARAVALADAHEPEVLELLQRLAQRRAVDAQPLRQLALRRELRAGWILSVEDQRAKLLGDLLGDSLLLDRLEHPRGHLNPAAYVVEELEVSVFAMVTGHQMSDQPAARTVSPTVVVLEDDVVIDVFEVVELADSIARVRSPFLFEIGEELVVQIASDAGVREASARVRGHAGDGDVRVTELELSDPTAPRPS
jgi:hypothetical protein